MVSRLASGALAVARALVHWFSINTESLAFFVAWMLMTYAAVGRSVRGWSGSIGIYLLVYALLGIIPALLKAVPAKSAPTPKHPNDV